MNDKGPLVKEPAYNSVSGAYRNDAENTKLPDFPVEDTPILLKAQDVQSQTKPHVEDPGLKILLTRMDSAFSAYSRESEQLSVLLSKSKDMPGWTSYHELLRQRTVEVVAYEHYRAIQEELFKRIVPPSTDDAPDPQFRWMIARTR